jgi:hypothetical protein
MLTINSLCLSKSGVYFVLICKSNLSSFALWRSSTFVIPSAYFIFNILHQHRV